MLTTNIVHKKSPKSVNSCQSCKCIITPNLVTLILRVAWCVIFYKKLLECYTYGVWPELSYNVNVYEKDIVSVIK